MPTESSALLVSIWRWTGLAGAILVLQVAAVVLCLRPAFRRFAYAVFAVVLADVGLVVLIRWLVGEMGRMDYSTRFLEWRWWFLALALAVGALPIPVWFGALRIAAGKSGRDKSEVAVVNPYFLTALVCWMGSVLVVAATGGTFTFLPRAARVTEYAVGVPGLPPKFDGVRIAVLSDHHVGSLNTPERARVRLLGLDRAEADLVVELGDITEADPSYQPEAAQIVGECRAPLGTFAVAGNFDVRCGTDSLGDALAKVGVTYLENESVKLMRNGAELWLVGLGDSWTGWDDIAKAVEDVPDRATVVLLSHSPDVVEQAAALEIPLMLSGHLHGGQAVIPFAGPVVGMSKYGTRFAWGHHRIGQTQLVVTRGLGEESFPFRLFCPPEIVVVTLRAASSVPLE
jgi:predicted MPP superfamily phosphohydrolase